MTKIYAVRWTESHQTFVKAENEVEARDKACYEENWLTDINVDLYDGIEAEELTEEEIKNLGI